MVEQRTGLVTGRSRFQDQVDALYSAFGEDFKAVDILNAYLQAYTFFLRSHVKQTHQQIRHHFASLVPLLLLLVYAIP